MPYASVMAAITANDEDAALAAIDRMHVTAEPHPIESPVLQALYRGMERIPERLRLHGYQFDLCEAAAAGNAAVLGMLIDWDRPESLENAYSPDGWTPLHLAAFMGRAEAAAILLAGPRTVQLNAVSRNPAANQPLHAAIAGRGDAAMIMLLIEAGADVTAVAGGGYTPLHLAASRGNEGLCDTLLAKGADPEAQSSDGKTAAAVAEERGHRTLAERLRQSVRS